MTIAWNVLKLKYIKVKYKLRTAAIVLKWYDMVFVWPGAKFYFTCKFLRYIADIKFLIVLHYFS